MGLVELIQDIALSFNGKTSDFDSDNGGSIPSRVAKAILIIENIAISYVRWYRHLCFPGGFYMPTPFSILFKVV